MNRLADVVRALLHLNLPVALYCLPGESEVQVCIQNSAEIQMEMHPEAFLEQQGFLFAPFQATHQHPFLFIQSDRQFSFPSQLEEILKYTQTQTHQTPAFHFPLVASTQRCDYDQSFDTLMHELQDGELKKLVLSRAIKLDSVQTDQAPDIFSQLHRVYPQAYRFCVIIPQQFIWLGASPERLLHYQSGRVETVSLAATRKADQRNHDPRLWNSKEVEEQQLVTSFVENMLHESGATHIEKSALQTKQAGHLIHLFQAFQAEVEATQLSVLLSNLHPTPAVCGLPKQLAMSHISRYESYERSYYAGYLGFVDARKAQLDLFVNLRSVCLTDQGASLFVGGGITRSSICSQEWQETEEKAQTILKVIHTK